MTTSIQSNTNDSALLVNGQVAVPFNLGGTTRHIESITCTQAGGALTFTLTPCILDFRSTTLTDGTTAPVILNTAATLTLPSGGTLGAVTTVSARLVLVAINNAGTIELAVVNIAGGNALDETGVISTTAISASATANNVFYSTTPRTNVAYRIVGVVDAVNTAGAWASPTLVQGQGGNALAAMGSLGYGQTWQDVSGSRVKATTYYNTTGKPIVVHVRMTSTSAAAVVITTDGLSISGQGQSSIGTATLAECIIRQGASYSVDVSAGTGTITQWQEYR